LAYAQKRGWKPYGEIIFLAAMFYLSHLVLDFFGGPVGILWPLTNMGYGVIVGLNVTQQGIVPLSMFDVHFIAEPIQVPNSITDVAAASTQSIGVAIMFLVALIVLKFGIRTSIKKGQQTYVDTMKIAHKNVCSDSEHNYRCS
jgi:hypothetical protein